MGCLKLTYRPENTLHVVKSKRSREQKVEWMWLSVDPLAEKYPDWSPYNYVFNSPLNFIDPDGRAPQANRWPPKGWWYNKGYKGRKVITLGLHNIKTPYASRRASTGTLDKPLVFVGNSIAGIYNGLASTWNKGMNGKTLGDMESESSPELAKLADRILEGEANQADYEAIFGVVLLRKVKIKKGVFSKSKQRKINDFIADIDNQNGHTYVNDGRNNSQILPKKGKNGDINYKTYDLNTPPSHAQRSNGAIRNRERIIIGSDNSVWHTNQHYYKGSIKKISIKE